MTVFLQNLINALQWGSFYALIAIGYSMVYSILMLFNFAHGDIFMTGSYIGFGVATALIALSASGMIALPSWLILVLTILLSMVLTSFLGMFIERVGYRPLRDAPRASAAITGLIVSSADGRRRLRATIGELTTQLMEERREELVTAFHGKDANT